jgi:hypothetical protein
MFICPSAKRGPWPTRRSTSASVTTTKVDGMLAFCTLSAGVQRARIPVRQRAR